MYNYLFLVNIINLHNFAALCKCVESVDGMVANKDHVQAYYHRNKALVAFRKTMARCRLDGSVPSHWSMLKHQIPLTALLVAFGDWAASTGDGLLVDHQSLTLSVMRKRLAATRGVHPSLGYDTSIERKQLQYLKRFNKLGC
jgi:hypothetical protein